MNETKKRDSRGTLRDYKKEYKKYGSSTKSKKYRAELNKYNRKKGTYGNGDGKDASHKGGKIVGFESQSKNRGRAEKSRLKKEIAVHKDHEIEMAMSELKSVCRNSAELIHKLSSGQYQDLPAWVQSKLTLSKHNIQSVYDWCKGKDGMYEGKYQGNPDMDKLYAYYSMAMQMIPNSPKQKDLRKKIKALRKKLKMDESKMSPKEMYDYFLYMRKYKPDIWKDMKKNKDVTKIMKKFDRKEELIRLTNLLPEHTVTFDKDEMEKLHMDGELVKVDDEGKEHTYVYNESDLGLTYKKGKTVKVTHKKSGKELIIIDKPNVRKEYEKIGFYVESLNEGSLFSMDNAETMVKVLVAGLKKINPEIKLGNIHYSDLGGPERVSIVGKFSLDKKIDWPNGILENSRWITFYLDNDGKLEVNVMGYPYDMRKQIKMRKSRNKDIKQVLARMLKHFMMLNKKYPEGLGARR